MTSQSRFVIKTIIHLITIYLGIEGKGDVDGSMVAEMFERHEYDAIARYCMSDVRRTRLVHQKMLIAMGGGYE